MADAADAQSAWLTFSMTAGRAASWSAQASAGGDDARSTIAAKMRSLSRWNIKNDCAVGEKRGNYSERTVFGAIRQSAWPD